MKHSACRLIWLCTHSYMMFTLTAIFWTGERKFQDTFAPVNESFMSLLPLGVKYVRTKAPVTKCNNAYKNLNHTFVHCKSYTVDDE